MRYAQSPRRRVLGSLIVFLVIVTLHRLSGPAGLVGFGKHADRVQIACRIWPDWEGSSPAQLVYENIVTEQSPHAFVGDAAFIGKKDRCLLAVSRLNQYQSSLDRNWDKVRWGEVQKRCTAAKLGHSLPEKVEMFDVWQQPPKQAETKFSPKERGQTAVVLRTWSDYNYTDSRRVWLRTLITETSLHSSGDHEVFFLVNVKNNIDLEDRDTYDRALGEFVPEEFRDMALLYNSRKLEKWYPKVAEHGAQDQMYQALQIFSHQFPHFTHIWQLEMDLRLTGHVHTTLESATAFSLAQPRRNIWERNGRFYIPALHGNSYEAFAAAVDLDTGETGIWGPPQTTDFEPKGPKPPPRSHRNWGVDEDPDLISLMPMIDPIGTDWIYETEIHNFADGTATPRRAAFVSMTRSSWRLLQLVSEAQRERGQWLVSEATLETFALLHGLKAVSVPHPITFDNNMTAETVEADINRGPVHSKAGGRAPSFSYTTSGWVTGPWFKASYWFAADDAPNRWHGYLGGECMPPMLLHPVKDE
ncbi:uncharacterized protein BCR38DRAFT_450545 [Pseudomassariella vexata]|uniref:Uncharacterized protein n=1 Tax=Pseudomassariella vexata TaxID=1141098 RepID=A0A1Y2DCK3_9PEZI|nr:uncharacterized protein BCR38DRAFT_450545 [Pseudomassariella vexata]ORY57002.1 hypothetical protein BCR38DRAFT_450545 [Pseudomassariella vexata]